MQILDETVKQTVTDRLLKLEKHMEGDVAFFYGSMTLASSVPFGISWSAWQLPPLMGRRGLSFC